MGDAIAEVGDAMEVLGQAAHHGRDGGAHALANPGWPKAEAEENVARGFRQQAEERVGVA